MADAATSNRRRLPTLERVRERVDYDPDTGNLLWRTDHSSRARAGAVAGWVTPEGYRELRIDGVTVRGHHVAWLLRYGAWPASEVDHRNRKRLDNRASNLRLATDSEQAQNRAVGRNNTSGHKGVHWDKSHGRWRAQVTLNKKKVLSARFASFEDAVQAYLAAVAEHHTHNAFESQQ